MKQCIAYGYSKQFSLPALRKYLSQGYRVTEYREVFHLKTDGDIFVFPYGVVVFWNSKTETRLKLKNALAPIMIDPLNEAIEDQFEFSFNSERFRIHEDHIQLLEENPLIMLALSHGIAQSVKLVELENQAAQTINNTAYIPQNMARTGSTQLNRKEIAKMRGQLFLVESDINHHYSLLDTPEFFWEYPELESYYQDIARYLDTQARVEILNQKLQMIHKLFDMLADEQKHKHSSLLEWIIIWLIAVEIFFFLGHDLLKIF